MAVVVSLINMKGGVGKTTVAAQLAHAVDADGLRVLAVDLDPQSNLSHSMMGRKEYLEPVSSKRPTVVHVLRDYIPPGEGRVAPYPVAPESVILPRAGYGRETKLDLIPSQLELSQVLRNRNGGEHQLARFLGRVHDRYDLIVIDCAPTESTLTQMAYFASRYVIVPVKLEFLATVGMPMLTRSLEEFRGANRDRELDIAGLILNDQSEYADTREKVTSIKNVIALAEERGWRVFDYRIPYSRSYPHAARGGVPLARTRYARRNRVEGFGRLKDEILQVIGLGEKTR